MKKAGEKLAARPAVIFIAIFLLAFTVRFIHLNQLTAMPTFDQPIMDEFYHLSLAKQILSPQGYPDEPYFRAPLYPYLLAGYLALAGKSLYLVRLYQIIIGSLLPLMVLLIGLKLLPRMAAYLAGAIAAIYPTFLYFDSSLLITSSITLLACLLLYQLYRCQEKPSTGNFILAGLILGAAGLARPNILLLGPALLGWILLIIKPKTGLRKALVNYLGMGAACIIIILPVTIRNYAVAGDFVFISWQGGYNFYLGNNRQASGWSATATGIDKSWQGGYEEAIAIAQNQANRFLKCSEVSGYWFNRALEEMIDNPGMFFTLLYRKLRLIFNGFEIPNNQHLYLVLGFSTAYRLTQFYEPIFFPFGLLAPLALIGLAFSFQSWRKFLILHLFLISYIMTLLLFFVCARFRQPMIPVFIILAVYGVIKVIDLIKNRQVYKIGITILALVLLFIESNHMLIDLDKNRMKADNNYLLGSSYLAKFKAKYGDGYQRLRPPYPPEINKATHHLNQTIKLDPYHSLGYNDLGTISMRCEQWDQASHFLTMAIRTDSSSYPAYINLARTLVINNSSDEAFDIMTKAARRFPYNHEVQYNFGLLAYDLGYYDLAEAALEKSLQIKPGNRVARDYLKAAKTAAGEK